MDKKFASFQRDTITKEEQLCSLYRAPPYETDFHVQLPNLTKSAYLSMLFILELACIAVGASQLKNKYHAQMSQLWSKNRAGKVNLSLYHGASYNEQNGVTCEAEHRILIKRGEFFIHHDNIWQTIIKLTRIRFFILDIICIITREVECNAD